MESILHEKFNKKITEEFSRELDIANEGLYIIEISARCRSEKQNRMPTLYKVGFGFGTKTKRIPSVYDPEWTGDFWNDTEEILLARAIYGEAGNQTRKVKIAVGWSIRNRLGKDVHPWRNYKTYHDVILDEDQYEAFTNSNVRSRIEDPLNTIDPTEKQSWYESYEVADSVINGLTKDESEGAVFFHDLRTSQERFLRANPNAKYIKQMGDLLFYGLKAL